MNTNMLGFRWFSSILRSSVSEESSLSIGRVKRGFQVHKVMPSMTLQKKLINIGQNENIDRV